MSVWVELGLDKGFVVTTGDEGLSCTRFEDQASVKAWVLHPSRPQHVSACLKRGELWVASESRTGIRIIRGNDGDWVRATLELDKGYVQALTIVPGVDGVHVLSLVGDRGWWVLWDHVLDSQVNEIRRVRVHGADEGNGRGAVTAISDRSGRVHLVYSPGKGPLYYRVGFPAGYGWSNAGVLNGPREELDKWSVLLDKKGGLHVLWLAEAGPETRLFYRSRSSGGWPCGQWGETVTVAVLKAPPAMNPPLLISCEQTTWATWEDGNSWLWRPVLLPVDPVPLTVHTRREWHIGDQGQGLKLNGTWASRIILSGTPPRPLDLTLKEEPAVEKEPVVEEEPVIREEPVVREEPQESTVSKQGATAKNVRVRSRRIGQGRPRIRFF